MKSAIPDRTDILDTLEDGVLSSNRYHHCDNATSQIIQEFIDRFHGSEDVFLYGMCYWFALILDNRFDGGSIVYDIIAGHFMWLHNGTAYDVKGAHEPPQRIKTLSEIKMEDPFVYLRIIRDCVLKLT